MKKRYVLWFSGNRPGEFEFLSHNQMHWTTSLKKIREEKESAIKEADDPEDMGTPKIFELLVKEVE